MGEKCVSETCVKFRAVKVNAITTHKCNALRENINAGSFFPMNQLWFKSGLPDLQPPNIICSTATNHNKLCAFIVADKKQSQLSNSILSQKSNN